MNQSFDVQLKNPFTMFNLIALVMIKVLKFLKSLKIKFKCTFWSSGIFLVPTINIYFPLTLYSRRGIAFEIEVLSFAAGFFIYEKLWEDNYFEK